MGIIHDLVLGGLISISLCSYIVKSSGDMYLLVDISLGVVGSLVDLVSKGVLCSSGAGSDGCVSILGDRLL